MARAAARVRFTPVPARNVPLDLSSIWLFSTCTQKELRLVRGHVDEVGAKEGAVLIEEGAIGQELFYIVEGEADVRRRGRTVARLVPGDHFGELALLDRKPRSATVVAHTDMKLLTMTRRELAALLEDVPPLAAKLLAAMAQRLRAADRKVDALISH